ncbi:MAG: GTP 3',8-cyclase MoaA [Puniceicoccales bacterium]
MNAGLDSAATTRVTSADARGRPLRDLRLSVIDRCNLRCQYCLPAELFGEDFKFRPINELLTFDELVAVARAFVGLGVEKLRLTGGEPLLRPKLPDLIARLRGLDPMLDIALTTNGVRLAALAGGLRESGLNRVNVSLDALDPAVAARMAGRKHDPLQVVESVAVAEAAGLGVKLNAVIKRGVNDSEILPLAKLCRERGWTLRFIEYMDVGATNGWRREDVVTGSEIRAMLDPLVPLPPKSAGDVARVYRYADGSGEVGFIESVSAPFCGGCTRARVSSTGELFTCLFASKGQSLKPWLATGELDAQLARIWSRRADRYSEVRGESQRDKSRAPEEMWRLGG